MALRAVFATTLHPRSPFNFEATVHKPSHFPAPVAAFEPASAPGRGARYWQTLRLSEGRVGLRMINVGTVDQPAIDVTVFAESQLPDEECSALVAELRWRFDLDSDLSEFQRRCGADPLLAPALQRWRGMRVSASGSLYEMLMVYVVLQNATVRRTVQMMNALLERYGALIDFDGRQLYAFWPAETLAATDEEDLRSLKVGYRARMLKRLSEAFEGGEMDEQRLRGLPMEEARQEMLTLYGIGPASVWYLLFEVLHHYDALDHVSLWEQRIYSRLFFDQEFVPANRIIDEAKRRWGEWRMLAAHYLFEDLFWRRRNEPVPWLEELIRL